MMNYLRTSNKGRDKVKNKYMILESILYTGERIYRRTIILSKNGSDLWPVQYHTY